MTLREARTQIASLHKDVAKKGLVCMLALVSPRRRQDSATPVVVKAIGKEIRSARRLRLRKVARVARKAA